MMTMTMMKKTKNLKTRLGIFKNMGGNIPGGNFLGGNFPGGSLMGGNCPGGDVNLICLENVLKISLQNILQKRF